MHLFISSLSIITIGLGNPLIQQPMDVGGSQKQLMVSKSSVETGGWLLLEYEYLKWDGILYSNSSKYTYSYDEHNVRIGSISKKWDGISWVNKRKWTAIYEDDIWTEDLDQVWDGSNWVNDRKWIYTYDNDDIWTETLRLDWDGTNWVNDSKSIYTYDNEDIWIESLILDWDGTDWVNYYKGMYYYDENNNWVEEILYIWKDYESEWHPMGWGPAHRRINTYDENNNMLTKMWQINWNSVNNEWTYVDNTYYEFWTYDENNNITEWLMQNWVNEWVDLSHKTYSYDENNNLTEVYGEWLDGSQWIHNTLSTNYIYCEYNEYFNCNGNCVAVGENLTDGLDCSGDCGGTAIQDNCDACDDDSTNDCVEDCAGEWGGNAVIDDCGECGGDNSTCTGCMNNIACNYDIDATLEGECQYAVENYNCDGICTTDTDGDGVCDELEIIGCQDQTACNFDENATDSGDCIHTDGVCESCVDGEIIDNDLDNDTVCDDMDDCEGYDDTIDSDGDGTPDGCDLSIYEGIIPDNYRIASIYPNPFNPVTKITYGLPENTDTQITVFGMGGTYIATLVNNFQTAGYHTISWNASSYPSGVYLIRMDSGDFTQTQKVVLVK